MEILPYDVDAAAWHAEARAALARQGKTPAFVDGQIAAVAATHRLALVTANMKDFVVFPHLQVVDWRKS